MRTSSAHSRALADHIIYLSALLADQPRQIDRYFDYFGDGRGGIRNADVSVTDAVHITLANAACVTSP